MRVVYLESPGNISISEHEKPVRKENEALIRIKAVGVCGSDIGAFRGTNPLVSYPRIIGHELAGEVVEIGTNEKNIKAGDRVIIDPYVYCGKCYPCSLGRTNCCEDLKVLGVHIDGGMAEFFTHPANLLNKVPDNIPWENIPAAEPLTIALHAIHRTNVKAGEHVVINGAGAIGLLVAMTAMAYGAAPIIIDLVEERLNKAVELGVKYTVNLSKEDPIEKIKAITNGRMAEVVVEASGANAAIKSSIDYASFAGRIALTGWPKGETLLNTSNMTKKELDIKGSRTSAGEFDEALKLISDKTIDISSIISKVVKLEEVPGIVMELSEHPERYLKVNAIV